MVSTQFPSYHLDVVLTEGNAPSNAAYSSQSTRNDTSSSLSSTAENSRHQCTMNVTPNAKTHYGNPAPRSAAKQEAPPATDDKAERPLVRNIDMEVLDQRISECEFILSNVSVWKCSSQKEKKY